MVSVRARVIGLSDLDRALAEITTAIVHPQSGIVDAMEIGLQITVQRARAYVRENFNTTGDFPKRIKTRKVNQFRVDLFVDAVYAAVHEYGLFEQVITDRQRRFFWAMWYETGNTMWKALALSVTYTIPARPYVRPAIDDTRDDVIRATAWALRHSIAKAARRYTR